LASLIQAILKTLKDSKLLFSYANGKSKINVTVDENAGEKSG
jgi:hypothetical protein